MDEDGASLGVGFEIDFHDAFGSLKTLDDIIGTTAAEAVRQFEKLEAASRGALNLTDATVQIKSFGSAATRELANVERANAKVEKAGEALSRQLDRQITTFGKTREELRAMKVETAALAAEQQGMTELAERLRAQEAALYDQEYAAMRKATQAAKSAAEDKAMAAQRAASAAEAEALAVQQAARAYQMFEAYAKQKVVASRESEVAAAAEVREAENLARAAAQLRASIDPAFAAQQRFDREMANARNLISQGAISLDDYAAKLRMERAAIDQSSEAVKNHGGAMAAIAPQAQDMFTQLSMGANVFSVLAIQGGQAASQMIYMEGAAGSFAKFMMGPWGLAVTAGMLVLGALTDNLFKSGEASDDLGKRQADLAADLDRTTGKVKEQVAWLSILANSREAEAKLAEGTKTYQSAQQRLRQGGMTAGMMFVSDPTGGRWYDSVSKSGRAYINDQLAKYNGGRNGGTTAEQFIKNINSAAAKDPSMAGAAKELEKYAFAINDASNGNRALQIQIARTAVAMGNATAEQKKLVAANTESSGSASQLIERQVALATATTPLEKARAQLAIVQQRGADADKAGGVALKQYEKDLTAASVAVKQAEAAEKAHTAAQRDSRRAASAARRDQNQAEERAREIAAVEAQIKNLGALADAYTLSGGAALVAEARVKAESKAIRDQGDVAAEVDRQVRLVISQRIADGERSTAATRAQADAQEFVNKMVEKGLIPASQANEYVKDRIADLPLLAAIEAAQQQGLGKDADRATKALENQRKERERLRFETTKTQVSVSSQAAQNQLAMLERELELVGATDAARVHELATLRAMQEVRAGLFDPAQAADYVAQQVHIADKAQQLREAQDDLNDSLRFTGDIWDSIARNVDNAARGMSNAFGRVGEAIGGLASVYANYQADMKKAEEERGARITAAGDNQARIDRANARFAIETATSQIGLYGDMSSAAKGFFKEGSDGYKAMAAAEKAFRAVEFALSVRAMAQDAIETASSIAKSGARTATKAVEAVVSAISSLPFPLNLAAGAATVAALASIGVAIAGSFGGSGKNSLERANDGTGTVLGDASAKSDSIKRSIDALKEVDTVMLTYSRQMAASLSSIDSQIGNLASLVVRTGNINASGGVSEGFATDTTGKVLSNLFQGGGLLKHIPIIGGLFGGIGNLIGSLFGTKTKVVGSGLYGGSQSLEEILAGGFDASYYSDIQKKKKFFGLTTSTKYSTQYAAADAGLENQFTLILRQFNEAILAAAGPLGAATDDIQKRLNGFVLNIGKIDLQGLTGDEIEEKLVAVFGAAADDMAKAAFPGIEKFQAVGEGLFETLVRVASTVESVTSSLDLLGSSASGMSIDLKMSLADQFDSVSDFSSAISSYFDTYYTKAEQAAAQTAQFSKVFDSLGMSMPSSLAAFRALVEAQDLTTAAGQATYATLLQLAPAFAELQGALNGAKSAADILSEREDLQRQLLEAQGNTAAIRALELAKLDQSNRALQEQIWAIQDAKEAADAAAQLKEAWSSVGDSIMDEVKRIRGITDGTGSGSFAALLGQFNAATALARAGDQDAAGTLTGLSQSLLNAAGNSATSKQELDRVKAQTAASLEATYAAINAFAKSGSASNADTLAAAATAASANSASTAAANDDMAAAVNELKAELAQLHSDLNSANAAIASNTGAMKRILERTSAQSGGDAFSTVAAA